jgi:murein L,D-transpeptidase YafK
VCYYSGDFGPKVRTGDNQSPEGFYFVQPRQLNPNSRFYLSFNLGYPNAYDRAHGRTGDALMVHGNCVSIGCYAMTDRSIEEIYALADAALRNGQAFFQVHVFPFRLTAEKLFRHRESRWYTFWQNLKEGYDSFEETARPPNVSIKNKRYVFDAR